ncbi:uncharacterized protein TNCV_1455901 [Trichonephila clavipes]|nr:uncharacterized protein TNCV_1455901 [Trichonephila clavipes]
MEPLSMPRGTQGPAEYSLKTSDIEQGCPTCGPPVQFNVGKATICDWRKNRRKLEQYCANSSGETLENRQTAKQSLYDKVDNALHIWFTQERQRGTPLSGPIIQEKAIQLNKLMNGDASA